MTLWIGIAAMIGLALAFVMLPLWRQGEARRGVLTAVALGLPLLSAGLYGFLGAPEVLDAQALVDAQGRRDAGAMLTALERTLAKEPQDAKGWSALGSSYIAMQRLADAEAALAKATALAPKDALILAQYAEVLGLQAGSLEGRPLQLLMEALEIDQDEEKALELAGLAAFQREEWAQSLYFWRRLLKKLPRESEFYDGIAQAVRLAEQKAAETSGLGDRARLAAPDTRKGRP